MTVPAPTIVQPNPAFEAQVARRAEQLCRSAEPHTSAGVCAIHESEARRQLFDQWQREGGGA